MPTENSKSHVRHILEVHQRRGFRMGRECALIRVVALKYAHDSVLPKQTELLRYFPVALISCVETFFKLAIKELIDHGDPYLRNAQKFKERWHYDYEVLTSLHGQVITIGDLISHHVRVNNLTTLIAEMSCVMGLKFENHLATSVDRYSVEVLKKEASPIISNIDKTFSQVSEVFRLRHIICHEIAYDFTTTKAEIAEFMDHISNFLHASSCLIDDTLYPDAPLTQMDINAEAANDYSGQKGILDELIGEAKEILSEKQRERFDIANAAWDKFLEASAELEGLEWEDGSMQPTVENLTRTDLTKERQVQIRKLIKQVKDTDLMIRDVTKKSV